VDRMSSSVRIVVCLVMGFPFSKLSVIVGHLCLTYATMKKMNTTIVKKYGSLERTILFFI